MKRLISAKLAGNILLVALGLLFIFHTPVLIRGASLENLVAAPITIILALCALRLALEN